MSRFSWHDVMDPADANAMERFERKEAAARMEEFGLTQREIARRLGIHAGTVHSWSVREERLRKRGYYRVCPFDYIVDTDMDVLPRKISRRFNTERAAQYMIDLCEVLAGPSSPPRDWLLMGTRRPA